MRKIMLKITSLLLAAVLSVGIVPDNVYADDQAEEIVLRVSNWEEYIDLGDWDEEELIELDSASIIGEQSIVEDFEDWYYETYGLKVRVEYSTFGTNEDLYSQLTLGDVYDLICPSEYMIMKLMREDMLTPLSDDFFDRDNELNYYVNGVSPFIWDTFESNEINGEKWSKYAACYMWGITGIVYNPEEVSFEEASTWQILNNPDFRRQVTIKDNVRDAYFPTVGILFREKLMSEEFRNDDNYRKNLLDVMNTADDETIAKAENLLKNIKNNVYSFETDSGKADMVSGKVFANLQWSGDAVYTMDQAEEDDLYLSWAVPEECTNLWLDGWVMLKEGINGDADRQHAAEAFINFLSRPDNAVRNMYYIGYTSSISGGESSLVFEYADWCYGAEEDEEDVVSYPLGYFFTGDNSDEDYILITSQELTHRQLSAQYPTQDEINRSAVMMYFDDETNAKINQMWINVRCFNISQVSDRTWLIMGCAAAAIAVAVVIYVLRHKIFRKRVKKGYYVAN